MDNAGIDQQVLSLPPFVSSYDADAEPAWRLARRMNEALAEAAHSRRFLAFASVPLQDPGAATAELRHCVTTLGMAGVQILTHVQGRNLDDVAFAPFFAAASELDVPVLIHPHGPTDSSRLGRYYLVNCLGNPFETAIAASHLLLGGVLARFSNLRVILAHAGGALPYVLGRVRRGMDVVPGAQIGRAAVEESLPRVYYDTVLHDPVALRFLINTVGAEQVVVGSDHPFDMGDDDPIATLRSVPLMSDVELAAISNNLGPLGRALSTDAPGKSHRRSI